jgi:hypothetical protein
MAQWLTFINAILYTVYQTRILSIDRFILENTQIYVRFCHQFVEFSEKFGKMYICQLQTIKSIFELF